MTKQKTIPELQAEIAANERQLAQLQHKQQQLENRRSYYEKGDRRKRAHRLITRGAAIYFNFVGRFVPPAFGEVELTPEELEEIRKREERKDRLHQNYLKRKASEPIGSSRFETMKSSLSRISRAPMTWTFDQIL